MASIAPQTGRWHPRLIEAAAAMHDDRLDIAERILKPHLKEDPFDVRAIRMLAELAARLVRKSSARVAMRPESHRFARFYVLRRAEAPAVLFEAGYVSNVADEQLLRSPEHRAALVASLAETIEADVAARIRR